MCIDKLPPPYCIDRRRNGVIDGRSRVTVALLNELRRVTVAVFGFGVACSPTVCIFVLIWLARVAAAARSFEFND